MSLDTLVLVLYLSIALLTAYMVSRALRERPREVYSLGRRVFIASVAAAVLVALLGLTSLYIHKYRGLYSDLDLPQKILLGEVLLVVPTQRTRVSVEEALLNRKSMRSWRPSPIDIEDLSMILWAAYGLVENIDGWLRRTSPSAGATYPMEIYVVVGERSVSTRTGFLEAGVYKYDPVRHSLRLVKRGDLREDLYTASLDQEWVRDAPVSIVICAVYKRTTRVYGERGYRYVYMEAGHIGQNIYLMATALGLGTVAVGAFYDDAVARVLGVSREEEPIYIFPVGVPVERFINSFRELERLYNEMRSRGS